MVQFWVGAGRFRGDAGRLYGDRRRALWVPIHGPVTCLLEWCTVSLRPVSCNALLTITDYLETLGTSSFKGVPAYSSRVPRTVGSSAGGGTLRRLGRALPQGRNSVGDPVRVPAVTSPRIDVSATRVPIERSVATRPIPAAPVCVLVHVWSCVSRERLASPARPARPPLAVRKGASQDGFEASS